MLPAVVIRDGVIYSSFGTKTITTNSELKQPSQLVNQLSITIKAQACPFFGCLWHWPHPINQCLLSVRWQNSCQYMLLSSPLAEEVVFQWVSPKNEETFPKISLGNFLLSLIAQYGVKSSSLIQAQSVARDGVSPEALRL